MLKTMLIHHPIQIICNTNATNLHMWRNSNVMFSAAMTKLRESKNKAKTFLTVRGSTLDARV